MAFLGGRELIWSAMNPYEKLFVFASFFLQVALLIYFAIRKWNFDLAMGWGWLVYALALPMIVISVVLLVAGKPWYLWLGGFLYAVFALFGYIVDIAYPVAWRSPIYPPVFIPYVLLYLSSLMFYWWPLARIWRPFWYIYAVLFIVSTGLNVSSHGYGI